MIALESIRHMKQFIRLVVVTFATYGILYVPLKSFASMPYENASCKDIKREHRPGKITYSINDTHLLVKNGVGNGKYSLDGNWFSITNGKTFKVRIRRDYEDLVVYATPSIWGEGPFVVPISPCPEILPYGLELFLR